MIPAVMWSDEGSYTCRLSQQLMVTAVLRDVQLRITGELYKCSLRWCDSVVPYISLCSAASGHCWSSGAVHIHRFVCSHHTTMYDQ